ncbi:MAG: hypothetical protein Q9185_003594 [Variospora sp. 1 TL-2023]
MLFCVPEFKMKEMKAFFFLSTISTLHRDMKIGEDNSLGITRATASEEENHGKSVDPDPESDDVSLNNYYVSRHRYDPTATWSKDEEQPLIRKLGIRVCAYCCLLFFALQLDRGNISQAFSDTFLEDLGMNTNDFNTGQTIF